MNERKSELAYSRDMLLYGLRSYRDSIAKAAEAMEDAIELLRRLLELLQRDEHSDDPADVYNDVSLLLHSLPAYLGDVEHYVGQINGVWQEITDDIADDIGDHPVSLLLQYEFLPESR